MADNQPIEELLEQGIQAAKKQNHATARQLLEQVVESDQHNEKAWFWLAAVIEDIDEKRICLNNVLMINPENQRAATLLEQLDQSDDEGESAGDGEEAPLTLAGVLERKPARGGPNQTVIIAGAAAGFLLVLIVAMLVFLGGGDDDKSDNTGAQNGTGSTEGQPAAVLPTHTPITDVTITPPPATWTPVPSSTPIPDTIAPIFPAPPETLPGTMILESGDVPGDRENHPIYLVKADGSGKRLLTNQSRGHAPALVANGSQYAYIEFLSGTREEILMINNVQGTDPRTASSYWQGTVSLFEPDTPTWSPGGNWITFTAVGMGAVLPDLYRARLAPIEGEEPALERLTNNDIIESWPAYSPDGTKIVYVSDRSKLDFGNPVDLSIYDLSTGFITDITTNGAGIVESAPDWSPDGQHIIFSGTEANGSDADIYRISALGPGAAEKIIDSDADDIRPRYSPDGRYIVFSSNRTGNWDVFVYDIVSGEMYQFTSDPQTDIASDWSQ